MFCFKQKTAYEVSISDMSSVVCSSDLWLEIPGHPPVKLNYSISNAPGGNRYRISVKRESGGLASNWLHDHAEPGTILKVVPPAGEFFLPEHPSPSERSVGKECVSKCRPRRSPNH